MVPSTDILDTGQRQWTNPVQGLCVAIYSLATFGTFGKIWMLRCCLNVVDDDDDDVMWRRVVTPCTTACQVLAPLPIGFAVFLVHLATIPITGTGINPARSLGAAVIYNTHHNAWNDHVSFSPIDQTVFGWSHESSRQCPVVWHCHLSPVCRINVDNTTGELHLVMTTCLCHWSFSFIEQVIWLGVSGFAYHTSNVW